MNDDDFDWAVFVFSSQNNWMQRFERIARKRFIDVSLADEAFNFALGKMSDEEWALLHKYKGASTREGFISTVYSNLLEDFARRKFGRKRAPSWVVRLGPTWQKIYKLLCLDRNHPDEIESKLSRDGEFGNTLGLAIRTIYAKVSDCGAKQMLQEYYSESNVEDLQDIAHNSSEPLLAFADCLVAFLSQPESTERFDSRSKLSLSAEEKLWLRVVYIDGLSVAQAADALSLKEHTLRRSLKKLCQRIRLEYEASGLDFSSVYEKFNY